MPNPPTSMTVAHSSPVHAKIALFRSLFCGREDVYPRRFESRKTGKSGYAPACAHEWVRGVCEEPRIKCSDCHQRRLLPVTDEVIAWHLSGTAGDGEPFVAGVYPLLADETCHFLAIDFDKVGWREDCEAFLDPCGCLRVPAALERSRSGHGGHVWIFFDRAIPAGLARRLGSYLLTETMESRPDVGLDSYDRLFPNQDTMPQGGFGNLIALPLQKRARELGNSVFLDETLTPWVDQWAFLASVGKVSRAHVEEITQDAERRGRILGVRLPPQEDVDDQPWAAPPSRHRRSPPIVGPLPKTLEVILGNWLYIAKEGLHPGLQNRLLRVAAFQNPEFYKAQAMRLSTFDMPRIIAWAEDHAHHIGLPRGCLDEVSQVLGDLGVLVVIRDERCTGTSLGVTFHGELRAEQVAAAHAMLAHETGVLAATTAFGKTVVAARAVPPDAEGAARARSATEAFLFGRLETLPSTRGRFALNATLPVAFDGQGNLEVDLLCAGARVAVELDGAQHLGDPVAYRRDRRKDVLLQEHGYVVLRFLAEDVGKELDLVLDTILRTLTGDRKAV